MIDEELRARFQDLRDQERSFVPRFGVPGRRRLVPRRLLATASALFLLAIVVLFSIRSRPTTFSASDRVAVQTIAAWHSPTDFLLQTPGSEILVSTPAIPDVRSMKGGL